MASRWICFWPGLAGLWKNGQGRSTLAAGAFAVLLNLALVATLVWPEILRTSTLIALWCVVAAFWGVSAWNSHRILTTIRRLPKEQDREAIFRQVQVDYLKGHWLEAESRLKDLIGGSREIQGDEYDVDAQLFLATLYRRTNRTSDAKRQLDVLTRLDGADKWRIEIERERQQIERMESEQAPATTSNAA